MSIELLPRAQVRDPHFRFQTIWYINTFKRKDYSITRGTTRCRFSNNSEYGSQQRYGVILHRP
jgi:hypothetical protein